MQNWSENEVWLAAPSGDGTEIWRLDAGSGGRIGLAGIKVGAFTVDPERPVAYVAVPSDPSVLAVSWTRDE